MNRIVMAIVALFVAVAVSACSLIETAERSPMTAQLVTNQITLRFIAAADEPVERAQRVRDVIAQIEGRATSDQTYTLADIDTAVREQIDWQGLSPSDQELLDFALTRANTALADLIGEGVVSPTERETVATLLRWIDNAALRVR